MTHTVDIHVVSSQLNLGGDRTLTKEEAVDYVKAEVIDICDKYELSPVTANIKLSTEGDPNDPVQKVMISLGTKGAVFNQSAHSRSIKKAIDRAIPDLDRQVRKAVHKRHDKPRNNARKARNAEKAAMLADDMLFVGE